MFKTTDNIGALRENIDISRLEAYVRKDAPSIVAPLKLQQFLHGQSNPTILITDANAKQYVLRKKPPGELLSKTAHAIEREYRVMKSLEHTDIPVPTMYCLCEDSSVVGTPFYIMQFLQGRIFTDPGLPSLSHDEKKACWFSAMDTLAKLHRVRPKDVALESYGRPTGFYSRQLKTFERLSPLQAATEDKDTAKKVGDIPHYGDMRPWFAANLPKDRTSIVHGDYKIDNCVFHATEPRVIGILDWELSTIGHPLSDLSNLLQPFGLPAKGESTLTGFVGREDMDGMPSKDELVARYAAGAGWNPNPELAFGEAFAHLRLAVITQGIAARVARRQATSTKAIHHAKMFLPLGRLGWERIVQKEAEAAALAKL